MKVKELMTTEVEACAANDDLAAAAMVMWRQDCGVVPVLDGGRRLQGVITDRDICIAAATRHRRPEELTVGEVMNRELRTVRGDEDVRQALDVMRTARVRRVPVVDGGGELTGIISISDVIRRARASGDGDGAVSSGEVLETLQAICTPAAETRGDEARTQRQRSDSRKHAHAGA